MAKTIEQRVDFPDVPPELLFDIYLDSKKHSEAVGAPVEIEPEAGGGFAAFDGVRGRNLLIHPKHMIVQSWRAKIWRPDEPDSVLVLTFTKTAGGAQVHLVQANVPDGAYETIDNGWRQHYWVQWSERLNAQRG